MSNLQETFARFEAHFGPVDNIKFLLASSDMTQADVTADIESLADGIDSGRLVASAFREVRPSRPALEC